MKIERSSLDQVKKRFETNKKKMEEKKKDYDLEHRLRELKEEVIDKIFFLFKIFLNLTYMFQISGREIKRVQKRKKEREKTKT